MKKLVLFGLLLLFPTIAFAVTSNPVTLNSSGNQVNVNYENQSNFGAVGAWGNTSTGNPGYIVLKGCDGLNVCAPYYLWVGSDGNLYLASYITISAYASFPTGNWNRSSMAVGTKVGSQ
jgi:hypothetical protein